MSKLLKKNDDTSLNHIRNTKIKFNSSKLTLQETHSTKNVHIIFSSHNDPALAAQQEQERKKNYIYINKLCCDYDIVSNLIRYTSLRLV